MIHNLKKKKHQNTLVPFSGLNCFARVRRICKRLQQKWPRYQTKHLLFLYIYTVYTG